MDLLKERLRTFVWNEIPVFVSVSPFPVIFPPRRKSMPSRILPFPVEWPVERNVLRFSRALMVASAWSALTVSLCQKENRDPRSTD
jgi:hypothetical protein